MLTQPETQRSLDIERKKRPKNDQKRRNTCIDQKKYIKKK